LSSFKQRRRNNFRLAQTHRFSHEIGEHWSNWCAVRWPNATLPPANHAICSAHYTGSLNIPIIKLYQRWNTSGMWNGNVQPVDESAISSFQSPNTL
jgi:hypothetical protein